MAYLYPDYSSTTDPWTGQLLAANQHHASLNRQYQMATASRFHPYGRFLEQQTSNLTYNMQEKYRQYYDQSLQLPLYDDAIYDVNKTNMDTMYSSSMNYNYPTLNFLNEASTKIEDHSRLYSESLPVGQLQNTGGQFYPNYGYCPNFGQYYQEDARRKMSPPTVGPTRTRDKYRVVYTDEQKIALEEEYEKNSFITETRRAELANEINLSERQIKFWFQNRRVKDRRGKTAKTKKVTDGKAKAKPNDEEEKRQKENVDVAKRVTGAEQSNKFPPCRYSNVDQGHGIKGTVTHGGMNTLHTGVDDCGAHTMYGCDFQVPSVRYPVSPSDWSGLAETSLLTTLNVSPILSSVENETRS